MVLSYDSYRILQSIINQYNLETAPQKTKEGHTLTKASHELIISFFSFKHKNEENIMQNYKKGLSEKISNIPLLDELKEQGHIQYTIIENNLNIKNDIKIKISDKGFQVIANIGFLQKIELFLKQYSILFGSILGGLIGASLLEIIRRIFF